MNLEFTEYNEHRLAYLHQPAQSTAPSVLFLSGFRSDMMGGKASALAEFCAEKQFGFTRFDYRAHGQSDGDFGDFTIGSALEDVLHIIDTVTSGKLILIGSSMGGWLMLLAALARPERIAGLVGIAAAPDFTEMLMWNLMSAAQRDRVMDEGELRQPSAYGGDLIITRGLIEEAREHLIMDHPIAIDAPVRLLHGMQDDEVPWQHAHALLERLSGEDVRLQLIKDGDHRLSRNQDIALLYATLEGLMQEIHGVQDSDAA